MEIKRKEIAITINSKDFKEQKVLKINLDMYVSQEICLSLLLLKESLIKTLELKFHNFCFFLNFQNEDPSIFSIVDFKKGVFKGKISKNSLEYILFFLLRYYRDGVGEADHIDVDFEDKIGNLVTLTFVCDNYIEYSATDVRNMLDL